MRFQEFINEVDDNVDTGAPVQISVSKYKSFILAFVRSVGIAPTGSSRGGPHVRFPFEGTIADFNKFFEPINVKVADTSASISGTFDTYELTQEKEFNSIPAGQKINWVNNVVGLDSKSSKMFNTKELSPDALGLAGENLNTEAIISKVSAAVKKQYDSKIAKDLIDLMKISKTTSNSIKLPESLTYNSKDLATISKDFGEIMSAIWAMSNLNFKQCYFPIVSNEQLIDFYGVRMDIKYPVSVKSGSGGKVTIQNIIDAIQNRAKTAKADHSKEKALRIFNIVNDNSAKPGMILLHQEMKTKAIQVLAKLMKTDYQSITWDSIQQWLAPYSNQQLKKLLAPFHKTLGMKLTDAIWARDDTMRFVVSPLGESIWKILNKDVDIQSSLTNVARQVTLLQVNINVKSSMITFQSNKFKDAEFQFGWAGYAAGNKLGFKMKLK